MQYITKLFVGACLAISLAACASTTQQPQLPQQVKQTNTGDLPVFSGADYELGAQDEIRITVFGEPELSGEFIVATNGKVSMPLIGEVQAAGLSVTQFQNQTQDLLRDGYLIDPKVSAEVLNYRPFFILGEVNAPGQYPYANGLTVVNAIATAGGYTYRGNSRDVMIKRPDAPGEVRVKLSPDLAVRPGDTIRVLERLF